MKYKFLLFGAGVGNNYGLDAIVIGTEKIIHSHFSDSEVWLPESGWKNLNYDNVLGNSKVIVKNGPIDIKLPYIHKRILQKLGLQHPQIISAHKRLVKKADCILSIGGDLYTLANKEKNWPYPYMIMEEGNRIMQKGKPYIIWCASVGPLEPAGEKMDDFVNHLRKCTAIIVREHDSFYYLRDKIGLKDNVFLATDPAFVMEPQSFVFPFLDHQSTSKLLAVNFSLAPVEHVYGHIPANEIQQKLINNVQELLSNLKIRILFVPHVKSDNKFLQPIFEILNNQYPERVSILPENLGAQKTKWAISQANALLTMRFHCSLAGFSTSTPTMVLVSTAKGAKMCKEMYGNLEYALNIGDMDSPILISKIRTLLDQEDAIKTKLAPVCQEMKNRAFSAGEILSNVL